MTGGNAGAGRFVTFEGGEGVGKSTAMGVAAELLQEARIDYICTREPGGTAVAEAIRDLLLHSDAEPLTDLTELLLMFAARAQSVEHVIRPALEQGTWVLCDRFTDSTIAYQGYGRGLPVERIRRLAAWVHGGLHPDLTILLDAPADVISARLAARDSSPDRIERQRGAFFDRVRDGYRALVKAEPDRFKVIDTGCTLAELREHVATLLGDLRSRTAPDNE